MSQLLLVIFAKGGLPYKATYVDLGLDMFWIRFWYDEWFTIIFLSCRHAGHTVKSSRHLY